MSKTTSIQWATSTINPIMGCKGCELWVTILQLIAIVYIVVRRFQGDYRKERLAGFFEGKLPGDILHMRRHLAAAIAEDAAIPSFQRLELMESIQSAIQSEYRCYAGILHSRHGKDDTQPDKNTNKGYADKFEVPKLFPGRMAEAARWKQLVEHDYPGKPWMEGLPRLIFISDMGDALSSSVPFAFLKSEIINNVASTNGTKHIWLWLTKRPARMAEFSQWLSEQGIDWPDNLVPMTSVTSQKSIARIAQLRRVRSKFHGLSVEPLWASVNLPLERISWCIVGGESGSFAKPFDLAWAREIMQQCKNSGTAFFMKQLGANPMNGQEQLVLNDSHGGNWDEWPEDLRVREFPRGFYDETMNRSKL